MTKSDRCPVCNAPSDTKLKPFCSQRCSDVDLGRWLKGVYRVPTNETPETEQSPDKD